MERFGWWWGIEVRRGPRALALGESDLHEIVHNGLTDEGERNLLDSYFRGQNIPPQFYVGLHSGSLVDTSTLANVSEPASGYARQQIARSAAGWPHLAQSSGDFLVSSSAVSFVVATDWAAMNQFFLASTSTGAVGSVILFGDLTRAYTLYSQDTFSLSPSVKAQ